MRRCGYVGGPRILTTKFGVTEATDLDSPLSLPLSERDLPLADPFQSDTKLPISF